jgi:NTP pyrophosphatase (non-canonical NTP hydrolase)
MVDALVRTPQREAHSGIQPPGLNAHSELRKPHPIVDSIREIQAIQKYFVQTGLEADNPHAVLGMIREETVELQEAMQTGDKGDIACELADVMLLSFRIAEHYEIPMDIAISDKMARNAEKYNPHTLRRMRNMGGLTTDEAMGILKNRWDRNRDKSEFCRVCGR